MLLPGVSAAAVCGDGTCEAGENSCSCPEDCGSCSGEVSGAVCSAFYCTENNICAIEKIPNCCGNDLCEESGDYTEGFGNCPADCEPRNVNIEIISPEPGYKARYGEELLYKAIADADGRSIAGIKVKVSGPFDQFTLFNDGKHDDEGFSDNVFGGYNTIQAGTTPGLWDVNFFTLFRNVTGNAVIQIEVFPIIDVELFVPAEEELGNTLSITGKFSINDKPVSIGVEATLRDDLDTIIVQKLIESDSDGKFSFDYRTTFVDAEGSWVFSLIGEDEFGNIVNEEKTIKIYKPGEIPNREIKLLKSLKSSYSGEDLIELAVSVTEESTQILGATVIANLFGAATRLTEIGFGEYAGTIKIPRGKGGDKSELIINVFNTDGGLIASEKYLVNIRPEKLILEIISPEKKLFEAGDAIDFKVLATYSDLTAVSNAKVFAVFNNKKLELKEESPGVFSAAYKINEKDQGQLEIIITVESSEGATGSASKSVFVSGKSFFYGIEENATSLIIVAIILIIGGTLIATQLKKKAVKKGKASKLKDLDQLEKHAQTMYFQEKSINKEEYNNLIDKYKKQRRELK
ncbi:hypothetical protein IIC68_02815 [archaeon]|nr:hypothetical protein [archaeon]